MSADGAGRMPPERWAQLERLFNEARDRSSAERPAFLDTACGGDADLRRDVAELLQQDDRSLLSAGAGAAAAAVLRVEPRIDQAGGRVGPYVLRSLVGSGAMGDVYRADDEVLHRTVAVKVLAHSLATDPARLARFEREARAVAALNHPNVAAIHGLEHANGIHALVLEYVEGVTLEEKLAGGALPVDEALALARQIADGLSAAHEAGIVHRDLKPANIRITPRGSVKLLDFGIAKFMNAEVPAAAALATREGLVLGTAAYMSPEQARGQAVDRRTDIWAFGCVLFEMLTGMRPFPGDTVADVVRAVLSSEPNLSALPAATPPRVRQLLRRCLAKNVDRRLRDIGDAALEIDDAVAAPGSDGGDAAAPRPVRASGRALPWIVSAVMAGVAVVALWTTAVEPRPQPPPKPVRLSMPLPPGVALFGIGRGSPVAVSPSGDRLAFVGLADSERQLYVLDLSRGESRAVPGTVGATNPFFSPDGASVGFTRGVPDGELVVAGVDDGRLMDLVSTRLLDREVRVVGSGTWPAPDTIIFAGAGPLAGRGLWRIHAGGGEKPEGIIPPGGGNAAWPQLAPDGKTLLYTTCKTPGFAACRVIARRMDGSNESVLVESASYARVARHTSGRDWLVFARPEGLLAAPLDLATLTVGPATLVQPGVTTNLSAGAYFDFSTDGLLAYVPGGLDELVKTLVWVDRAGTPTEIAAYEGISFEMALSPDGRRLVSPGISNNSADRDLWLYDLERGGTPRRLTLGGQHFNPVWTPDGNRIVYASVQPQSGLYWQAADGSDEPELLVQGNGESLVPSSVSRENVLAFSRSEPGDARKSAINLMPLDRSRPAEPFVSTSFGDHDGVFSPDGRWLAFQSHMSGKFQIYLASVDGRVRRVPVSSAEGWQPRWSADGRELYYRSGRPIAGQGDLMAVAVDTSGLKPVIGDPRVLFPNRFQGATGVSPDGRFLYLKPTPAESPSRSINLVLNWFEELKVRVPQR